MNAPEGGWESLVEIDDDGYPTEGFLMEIVGRWADIDATALHAILTRFTELSPHGEYWTGVYNLSHGAKPEEDKLYHAFGTGGWSGCEELMEKIGGTIGFITCWQATIRGGLYLFSFPFDEK